MKYIKKCQAVIFVVGSGRKFLLGYLPSFIIIGIPIGDVVFRYCAKFYFISIVFLFNYFILIAFLLTYFI